MLRAAEISLDDVDHVVLHQASELVLATLQRSLAIPDEKFVPHGAIIDTAHDGNRAVELAKGGMS